MPKATLLIEAGRSAGYLGDTGPSPFPFRSRWPRRVDAHMAAGSCTPERRDASCSRNPPLPLRSHHAMRFAWLTSVICYAPLGLTMPATSRSQVRLLPSGSRETRPLPLVPHPSTERTRPIAPTLFRRESDAARSLANRCPAPVLAPRTRESVPVVAMLTPRRAARRCGSDLARPPG